MPGIAGSGFVRPGFVRALLSVWAVAAVALIAAAPASAMPVAGVNFLGMGHTLTSSVVTGDPPDPSGAAGPSDYVQVVNGGIKIWNKSGTALIAAKATNTLWASYAGTNAGNGCAARNDGDAIVRYDRAADRWLVAQMSLPNTSTNGGPAFECVAVSKTGDPTGAWWLYDFRLSAAFIDQPKVSVWPDSYYFSANELDASGTYLGDEVCAWNRAAMLAGGAAAETPQCFLLASPTNAACPATQTHVPFALLPANVDGGVPPPAGSPEYLVELGVDQCSGPYNQLDVWKFHVDWSTPANSTLTGPTVLTTASYTPACMSSLSGPPNCIPQTGSTTTMDAVSDRPMDRLAYRNFGDHQSLLVDHSVTAGASAGVRWYELRLAGQTPSIYQQGTIAPADTNWRWMGSIAQDQAGDMVAGYSISSSTTHPGIAWSGRLVGDTQGMMGQGEATIDTGAAAAYADLTGRSRWGDYATMTVDPSDDCTFWFTSEVYAAAMFGGWDTYIASVKFPTCGANDFSLSPPAGVSAAQGSSAPTTVGTALTKGIPENIAFYVQDLPQGTTASLSPPSVTAGTSSALTLSPGYSTPPGTYTVGVIGQAPSAVHYATLTFTVTPGPPCPAGQTGTPPNCMTPLPPQCLAGQTGTPPNCVTTHTLTVSVGGTGTGTVGGSGISCPGSCSQSYASGTAVSLTATPAAGYAFAGWGGACAGTAGCSVTMNSDQSVSATFTGPSSPTIIINNGPTTITIVQNKTTVVIVINESVSCPAGLASCPVSATLTLPGGTAAARKKRAAPVKIGGADLVVPPGQMHQLKVTLNKRGAALLRRRGHLRANLTVTVHHGSDRPTVRTRMIALKAPKKG